MNITPSTINIYVLIAAFLFTGFALIWKRNNWLNLFIKMLMIAMAIFGYIIIFKS